jgi:hypothetical protein
MPYGVDDPQSQARNVAFLQGLHEFGWAVRALITAPLETNEETRRHLRHSVEAGGLLSYVPNFVDQFRKGGSICGSHDGAVDLAGVV